MAMATFVNRGNKIRAVVRLNGQGGTKSFDTQKEAKDWATRMEDSIKARAKFGGGMTLGALMTKFRIEVIERKPYPSRAGAQLKAFAREFELVDIADMDAQWWIDTVRGFGVAPGSAKRYMGHITSALKTGAGLWGIEVDWKGFNDACETLEKLHLIAEGNSRERRLKAGELEKIKARTQFLRMPMHDIIDFALELGMRVGEICRLEWADLDEKRRMIWVRHRKHPTKKMKNTKEVPLLGQSLAIIQRQPRVDADGNPAKFIFPYVSQSIGQAFTAAAKAAKIENLTFHDLRHEAISRLFEQGYGIPEVALVSGHSSWKSLKRYTQLNPEGLHDGPLARRAA
jgi:integrase